MTWQQYLVMKILEECNEIAQRCSKALLFGLDEVQEGQPYTNAERITSEGNDLIGVLQLAEYYGVINSPFQYVPTKKIIGLTEHSSQLWARQEYAVMRIQHLCNETSLACSIGLLVGLDKTENGQSITCAEIITTKISELIGILHEAAYDGVVTFPGDDDAHLRKIQKIIYHAEYSRDRGTLV